MRQFKVLLIFAVVITLSFSVFACSNSDKEVIAKVNGKEIYKSEMDSLMKQVKTKVKNSGMKLDSERGKQMLEKYKSKVVNSLIQKEIVEQLAEKNDIEIKDKDVNKKVDKQIKSYKEKMGKEKFDKYMKENNLTKDYIKEQTHYQMLQKELYEKIVKDVEVKDQEVKDYFNKNKEKLQQVKLRQIMLKKSKDNKVKDKADEVLNKLEEGAQFADLAKKYSDQKGAKDSGGLIPKFISRNSYFSKSLLDTAFSLQEGEYSKEPVETKSAYYIIKVEKKKDTYEELKDTVKNKLLQQRKRQKFSDYYKKQKKDFKIENIYEEKLKKENKGKNESEEK